MNIIRNLQLAGSVKERGRRYHILIVIPLATLIFCMSICSASSGYYDYKTKLADLTVINVSKEKIDLEFNFPREKQFPNMMTFNKDEWYGWYDIKVFELDNTSQGTIKLIKNKITAGTILFYVMELLHKGAIVYTKDGKSEL